MPLGQYKKKYIFNAGVKMFEWESVYLTLGYV